MQISDKMVEEFKEIYRKKEGMELEDSEAREAARGLLGLAELLYDMAAKDAQKKQRLKTEPDGFPVDGNYTCLLCGTSINPQTGWYHYDGPRCLLCHKAVQSGAIPSFVLKNRDSYFSTWKLADAFNVRTVTIRKMVRNGELKARTILNDNGKVHEYIFLKKENPDLIEHCNPVRKSYDRHRDKVTKKLIREEKEKMRKELAKYKLKRKLRS